MSELTATEIQLQNDILDLLAGSATNTMPASNVRAELVAKGWRKLPASGFFYSRLEALGFTVMTKNSRHTVSIGE